MFGNNKKHRIKEDRPIIDVKGNRNVTTAHPETNPQALEIQLYAIDKGPKMLPRDKRFKVWLALIGIGGWFVCCFALVAYRLRSDDLELMEREVYEELKVKKEVEKFQERKRLEDNLRTKNPSTPSFDSLVKDSRSNAIKAQDDFKAARGEPRF